MNPCNSDYLIINPVIEVTGHVLIKSIGAFGRLTLTEIMIAV